jgi:ribosomal protein L37E
MSDALEALAAVRYALATRGSAYVEAVLRKLDRDTPPDVIVSALLRPGSKPRTVLGALAKQQEIAPSFTCPRCGRTSYNPNDAREGYCGACHDWTRTTPPSPR